MTFAKQWEQRQSPNAVWADRYTAGFEIAGAFLRDSEAAHTAALEKERQHVEAERLARERELTQAQALAEAERQRALEEIRHTARLRKLLWSAVAAGVAAAVLAAVAIVLYVGMRRARDVSVQQSVLADIQRLATVSTAVAPQFPHRSLLLATEALTAARSDVMTRQGLRIADAEQSLRDALATSSGVALPVVADASDLAALSPDGRWLAIGTSSGRCSLVDLRADNPYASTATLAGHEGRILAMAISADSRSLVTASIDRTARVWDLTVRNPAANPVVLRGHRDRITAVAISPDRRSIATGGADHSVRLWRPAAADPAARAVELHGHRHAVTSAVFTNDSRRLVTGSGTSEHFGAADIRVWDLTAANAPDQSIALPVEGGFVGLKISPGGRWLIGETSYHGYVWDLRSQELARTRQEFTAHVTVSQDDRWLVVSGGVLEDPVLLNLDEPSRQTVRLPRHRAGDNRGYFFAFSGDHRWLVSTAVGSDQSVLWDLKAGDPSAKSFTLTGHVGDVLAATFSPDSRRLVTSARSQNGVLAWDLTQPDPSTGPVLRRGAEGDVGRLEFTADNRWLIGRVSGGNGLHLWSVEGDDTAASTRLGPSRPAPRVAISPDNRWLATGDESSAQARRLGGDASGTLFLPGTRNTGAIAFSADSQWLAVGGDGGVGVWDLAKAGKQTEVVAPTHMVRIPRAGGLAVDRITVVAVGANRRLATGRTIGTVRLTDLSASDPEKALVVLTTEVLLPRFLGFSPDGRWLVAGGARDARLWDLSSFDASAPAKMERKLGSPAEVTSIAFSADSRWLAIGRGTGTVDVWDLRNLAVPLKPLVLQAQGKVAALAFTPDSRRLVTGDGRFGGTTETGSAARVWDLSAADASRPTLVLDGHEQGLLSVAVSPDGRTLMTGSLDATVRIWDLSARNVAQTALVLRLDGPIPVIAPAADSQSVVTWTSNGTLRRWALDPAELLSRARTVAGRNVTQQEWSRYFPGRPYRKTFDGLPIHPTVIAEIARVIGQTGTDAGLDALQGDLRTEGRRAVVEHLIDGARTAASDGDTEPAFAQAKTAARLDAAAGGAATDEVKRIAAGALVTKGKELIAVTPLPDAAGAMTVFREAIALDPKLPLTEREGRDLATTRLTELVRDRLGHSPYVTAGALDDDRRLLDVALRFDETLRARPEFAALERRVAAGPRQLADHASVTEVVKTWDGLLAAGQVTEAVAAYVAFARRSPASPIPAAMLNRLCWQGTLHAAAAAVMPACDQAVKLEQNSAAYRDSRGLARALLGDRKGAISDWQYFVDHGRAPEAQRGQRRRWIGELEAGRSFDLTDDLRRQLLKQ